MHSGFTNMRSALPMNLKAHHPGFKVWAGAQADIDRIVSIWRECLASTKGPFLFGKRPGMADAMFAPVVTRLRTWQPTLTATTRAYCAAVRAHPLLGRCHRIILVGWSEIPLFEQVEAVNGARDSSRRELQSVHERNR